MKVLIAGQPDKTQNYERALEKCSASFLTGLDKIFALECTHLLLPGGTDPDPSLFGQLDAGSRQINRELDLAQLSLLDCFVRSRKPVLGICKGMQLINIYFGGSLIQHLPSHTSHESSGRDQLHPVRNLPQSLMYRLYGASCLVNSAHHQGCTQIPPVFSVTQTAPDGVAEAIEHKKSPILGVQWHPERTGLLSGQPALADGQKLISFFLTL